MKVSLGAKIVTFLIVFAVVLSGVSIVMSYQAIQGMNDDHYLNRSNEIAATIARVVNADDLAKLRNQVEEIYRASDNRVTSDEWGSPEFEAYVAQFSQLTQTPEYQRVLEQLRRLQEVNDVDCFYTTFVSNENKHVIYLVDAAEEDPCPIGCIDPLYEVNYRVMDDPEVGFPAYITDTQEYGWLVSAGAPVYDSAGNVVCYAVNDISMDVIKKREADYVWRLSGALVGLTIALCIVMILVVRHLIVRPLNTLSNAASSYCAPQEAGHATFANLDIHSKDEIGELHRSMIQMEHDIDTYIDNLVETRAKLKDTRREADLMNDLAHKDALTGIRNRLAYEQEVSLLDRGLEVGQDAFGIAVIDLNDLKVINDTYGHDRGNESLVKLSNIICSVFGHSPVFRIGGDEFAVVLRNNDYEKVVELAAEFNEIIKAQANATSNEGRPWEKTSAAIGYALYDSKLDDGADSVFRRADKQMYENKKQMKGEASVR